jgi:hypothetical protein
MGNQNVRFKRFRCYNRNIFEKDLIRRHLITKFNIVVKDHNYYTSLL